MSTRLPLRYRWDHHHPIHRAGVRTFNVVAARLPLAPKYRLTTMIKRRRIPYSLIESAATVVQIGAPLDTLRAGRARAMTFAMLTRDGGRCIVIEPDPISAEELRRTFERRGYDHALVINAGAWHERTTLEMLIDDEHPATNVVASLADGSDRSRYRSVEVDAAPLDDLLAEAGVGLVDLLSITTNGAERSIAAGATHTLARAAFVSLARTEESFDDVMDGAGLSFRAFDDRGMTYGRTEAVGGHPTRSGR